MITVHNTLTRQKEEFKPIKPGNVSMYHCGPTVYDRAHIGNLRAFLLADLLRRIFEQNGFEVNQVMNITDVDDKTIKRSRDEGISLNKLTKKYEQIFFDDLDALNIKKPLKLPRATESVGLMIKLIQKLLENGFAYKGSDGVYFSIDKDDKYGELAKLPKNRQSDSRIKNDEYDKESPQDFALWKFYTKEDGDVVWEAPFGKGRPGWHIECSAMSMDALGETFDIHTGGVDLIFPHHTNEIAQSEAATGKHFVNYWMHNNFILVDDKKMSKSLGNFYTLQDIVKKEIDPLAYRYWLLTAHYRTLVNFTWDAVEGAQNAFKKLQVFVIELPSDGKIDIAYKAEFESFIYDDLDTPKAIALTWDLAKDPEVLPEDKKATILYFDEVLGLNLKNLKQEEIPTDIAELAKKRETAREEKNWHLSDEIRRNIEARGYDLKDTEDGPKITKK
ncbi:MAG: cysteine--tRNA ligase [Candidatus Paceibacterota bacterium]|jgi:cysteinyl-tRNA synthetase